jgi:hypothetical protein
VNVVFLDIDDVMTHNGHLVRSEHYVGLEFCPVSVRRLKELLTYTDAKIVVSSTWGIGETIESINLEVFDFYDLSDYIVGITPFLGEYAGNRGNEIQLYIDRVRGTEREVTNFIILDDDNDMLHLRHRLVHCDTIYGFTEKAKFEALKLFKFKEES